MFILNACDNVSVLKISYFIKELLNIAFILIPIILVVFITIDFAKSVISEEKVMQDNLKLVIRRIIYVVAIFLVPFIVEYSINHLIDSDVGYGKCLNVTMAKIESQIKKNKKACEIQGNKWDPTSNECLYPEYTPNSKIPSYTESKLKPGESSDSTSSNNNSTTQKASAGQGIWVAHQKNSTSSVNEAIKAGFWGIEVDVSKKNGNDFKLYHTNTSEYKNGYTLSAFLDTCKKNNITAILDWGAGDVSAGISLVKEKGMMKNTIFQGGISFAKKVHKKDSNARIWVESQNKININDLKQVKDYVEGVNIFAQKLEKSYITDIHNIGMTVCAYSWSGNGMYPKAGFSAETLKSWGVEYLMSDKIGK